MTVSVDETAWHQLVPRLLSEHGSRTVAEIGVWRGELSERILAECPTVTRLFLIDAWTMVYGHDPKRDQWMVFGPGTTQQHMEDAFLHVSLTMRHRGERVRILRRYSVEAAKEIPDHSLDAVLIDATHTYHACKEDILTWAPKVRVGGLLIGDDLSPWFPGVQVAVEECFGSDFRALGQTFWKILTEDNHARLAGIARESLSQ